MTNRELLIQAKALIAKPENWSKKAYARMDNGNECLYSFMYASKFCSFGAIYRVLYQENIVKDERKALINSAYESLKNAAGCGIMRFNDMATHGQILYVYNKAIEQSN